MTSSRASAIGFCLLALTGPALFAQTVPSLRSVVNAFDSTSRLSPGARAIAFGSNLAGSTTTGTGQTQVIFSSNGGGQAAISFSSPTQINFQVPPTLKPNAEYQVVVINQGVFSNPILVVIDPYAPALANSGNGVATATHSDHSIVNVDSPAMTGEKITVYATGLGVPDPPRAPVSPTVAGALAVIESIFPFNPAGVDGVTFAVPVGVSSGFQPVVLSIGGQTSQTVLLPVQATGLYASQTGVTLHGVAGGTAALLQNVTIASNNGAISWNVTVTTLSGGAWLRVPNGVGTSDPLKPAPTIQITATANALQPGDYYGLVTVHPINSNSDVLISVVLSVRAQNQSPGPAVDPTGIIFVAGPSQIPSARNITLTNPGTVALTFTTTSTFPPNNNWFKVVPTAGNLPAGQTLTVAVQPSTGLLAGVYVGSLSFQFSDGSTRVVNLLFVVAAGATPSGPNGAVLAEGTQPQAGCNPTMLLPIFTLLGVNFTSPVAWPSAIEADIIDDCGSPMSSGSVIASFSNTDDPKSLLYFQNGRWSGTWTPVHPLAALTVKLTATSFSPALTGSALLSGNAPPNPLVPIVSTNGVVSQASYATSPAPGTLIAIFGSALADHESFANGLPLPDTVLTTSVLVGGAMAPLLYVSEGQINAQAPYGMTRGNYYIVVQRGTASSSPAPIAVFASQPAVFTVDSSGKGQGTIFKVTPTAQVLAAPGAAVTAGDVLTIYCAGLGEVLPAVVEGVGAPGPPNLANTVNTVTATIGTKDATVRFSGLTPGFVGLYQVNMIVPQGVATGDAVPLVLTVAGISSLPVTLAVQ